MNRLVEIFILKKNEVISFDIFDTLLERTVTLPSDTFEIVGKRTGTDPQKFRENRCRAEARARQKANNGEVDLDRIYEELAIDYVDSVEQLKRAEIDVELEICRPKISVVKFYNQCVDADKRIILISDMYLSSKQITAMLEKCGINVYEGLYVSNDYGVNKVNGQLYDLVLQEKCIEPSKMIHIGDGIKPDYMGAKKAGVSSHLIFKSGIIKRCYKKAKRKLER